MTRVLTKCMLVAAVASLAFAGSTTASFAAKKKAAAKACAPWSYATAKCSNNACTMQRCGVDGKWYPSMAWCWQPACPK